MRDNARPLLPGATVGVFGTGQLGRMLGMAARRMDYRFAAFGPDAEESPAGQVADWTVSGAYTDRDAVRRFVRGVDVVTFEFENVAAEVAEVAAEEGVPVRPDGAVLHTAQNRLREKTFFAEAGLPVTPFAHVESESALRDALETLGTPAILKTAAFGYDGKGQVRIDVPSDAAAAWQAINRAPAVLEAFVDFEREVSVVAARGVNGEFVSYPVIENRHHNHILDVSIAPAQIAPATARHAAELARAVLEALDVVGVLCVEFFLKGDGELLINEIAPRPHNSGHLTVDAAVTSQFEQQLRAVCGLPLGAPDLVCASVMVNLLGDLWAAGEPDWTALCGIPNCKLHLYGKREARPGRKMGHVTVLAERVADALDAGLRARKLLSPPSPTED